MRSLAARGLARVRRQALVAYGSVAARRALVPIHRFVRDLALRGLGIDNDVPETNGEAWFLTEVSRDRRLEVIVDVGANRGEYVQAVHERAPRARILAIEPHPRVFAELQRRVGGLGVETIQCALGDSPGTATLHDYGSDGTVHASLHREVIEEIHRQPALGIEVPVRTLDELCASLEIERIDLLKIDTEGHELAVLRGATRMLAERRIRTIHFEFNAMNLMSHVTFRDFRLLLAGFELRRLLRDGSVTIDDHSPLDSEIYAYQNVIAVRDDA